MYSEPALPDTKAKLVIALLGDEATYLLDYQAKVSKDLLHLPSPDWIDRIFVNSDRTPQVLRSLQQFYGSGRLANTGYLSILPVDQGVEHSAGASFALNPIYFDLENIVKLAIASGCNAVAKTLGVLRMTSHKYAHKIPLIMKLNHNELLTYPNQLDQITFASVEQAWNLGAVAVGATIYFGSEGIIGTIQPNLTSKHSLDTHRSLHCWHRQIQSGCYFQHRKGA